MDNRPILVADDDHLSNRLLQGLLQKWGHAVVLATDGTQALERLRAEDGPRLAILDWMMPSCSGPDICRQLREHPPGHPVYLILLTFRATADDIAAGLESGADDYLVKPCEPTELRARVRVGLRMLDLQDALLDRVEQMNRFLGMAAHDLRNPLGCIKVYSALLLDAVPGISLNPMQEKFVTSIQRSSDFMLRLVENFLETSAIQDGKLVLNVVEQDLIALLRRNLEMNRVLAERKDISLTFSCTDEIMALPLDADKIDQVMNNLVSNATKYSIGHTTVAISVVRCPEEVVISVADEGSGIAAEDLGKLFIAYPRLSNQPTGGERSTGLGLSIVRRIVEGHGGRIWVDSEVDRGSTFHFTLPTQRPSA